MSTSSPELERGKTPLDAQGPHQATRFSEPGHLVVDFSPMPRLRESDQSWVWAAVDIETGWAYAELQPDLSAESAHAFLVAVKEQAIFRIRSVVAEATAIGRHGSGDVSYFTEVCEQLGVDYQERGSAIDAPMVGEALLSKVVRDSERCGLRAVAEFSGFLKEFVERHNETLNPNRPSRETPLQALGRWRAERPDLFIPGSARP